MDHIDAAPDTAPASSEPEAVQTETITEAAPPPDPSPQLAPEPFPTAPENAVVALLNEAEEICLFWGGEVGNKLRDLICKARDLL